MDRRRGKGVELPTLAVTAIVHGGWIALTAGHALIPWPLLMLAGGWIVAWHGSLQHEVIHGHPTGRRRIDDAIGSVPLSLWLPYRVYRRSHLAHHGSPAITDPLQDPESRYLRDHRGIARQVARLQSTLAGQMIAGPVIRSTTWMAPPVWYWPVRRPDDWI